MRCLVIGYGSIGKKHAEILLQLKFYVALVTSQKVDIFKCYSSVESAFNDDTFDYIVIANATFSHHETFLQLIQCHYSGIVLVEKPLFSTAMPLSKNNIAKILVAYNLRFHELLNHAKKLIRDEKLLTFSAYVGSYLPAWRQKIDYQNCYSAKKEYGGGALRDLSHELDCCIWFCGPSLELTSLGGHFSPLEITSDDSYSILMKNTHCPMANLQMNYLDRHPHRNIIINTTHQSLFIDLINGLLYVNGNIIINSAGISETYIKQHLAVLNGEFDNFCDYEHGLYLVKLIDIIEYANISQTWVKV